MMPISETIMPLTAPAIIMETENAFVDERGGC
jgi:hypothetical protein